MNAYQLPTSDQRRGVWIRARHARRQRALRPSQAAGALRLSLGSLQALMGLAAFQARTR